MNEEINNKKLDEKSLEEVSGGYIGFQDPAYAEGAHVYYRFGGSELYYIESSKWGALDNCYKYIIIALDNSKCYAGVHEDEISYYPFV